jgi:hypothetical protein
MRISLVREPDTPETDTSAKRHHLSGRLVDSSFGAYAASGKAVMT